MSSRCRLTNWRLFFQNLPRRTKLPSNKFWIKQSTPCRWSNPQSYLWWTGGIVWTKATHYWRTNLENLRKSWKLVKILNWALAIGRSLLRLHHKTLLVCGKIYIQLTTAISKKKLFGCAVLYFCFYYWNNLISGVFTLNLIMLPNTNF